MLWDGKSGLTETVVMGPGQAILFYGRQSLGEGLSMDKVCDAIFMLTGAISWVGKQVWLNTNAITLQEGQQLITQTITKWCVEARRPGCPHTYPHALPSFSFSSQDGLPPEVRVPSTDKYTEDPMHTHQTPHHGWGQIPQQGWNHGQMQQDLWAAQPHHLQLHWITDLRVTKVQHQLPHQCHLGLRVLEAPGIHTVAKAAGTWRPYENQPTNLQRQGHKRCHHLSKLVLDLIVYNHAECQDHTLLPYAICSLQGYPGSWWKVQGQTSLWMVYSPYWMNITTMSRP